MTHHQVRRVVRIERRFLALLIDRYAEVQTETARVGVLLDSDGYDELFRQRKAAAYAALRARRNRAVLRHVFGMEKVR